MNYKIRALLTSTLDLNKWLTSCADCFTAGNIAPGPHSESSVTFVGGVTNIKFLVTAGSISPEVEIFHSHYGIEIMPQ
jgi:hypothetical protein